MTALSPSERLSYVLFSMPREKKKRLEKESFQKWLFRILPLNGMGSLSQISFVEIPDSLTHEDK